MRAIFIIRQIKEQQAKSHTDEQGNPVEQSKIQCIDGDNCKLFEALGVNQANLKQWFDDVEDLDGEDFIKVHNDRGITTGPGLPYYPVHPPRRAQNHEAKARLPPGCGFFCLHLHFAGRAAKRRTECFNGGLFIGLEDTKGPVCPSVARPDALRAERVEGQQ